MTTHRSTRPGAGRVARFRLDVAEWLVLREVLRDEAPGATPTAFDPPAFGLPAGGGLSTRERRWAVDALNRRHLVLAPERNGAVRIHPGALPGLLLLLQPQVRLDVSSWSGPTAITQAVAWGAGYTAALARRCRATSAHGADVAGQEAAVDLALSGGGGLVDEVLRALPPSPPTTAEGETVEVGWQESVAVAHALRAGRADVAAHLSGLPEPALELLGAVSTSLTGGASVTAAARREAAEAAATLAFHEVWLWTASDIVELLEATSQSVTLRRSTAARLRTRLLAGVTALLHPAGVA